MKGLKMLHKTGLLTLTVLLFSSNIADAQPRRQLDWLRQIGAGGNTFGQLGSSEYLQKELKLTAAQKKRMKEINLQMMGTRAILTDDVSSELGISDSQKKQIQEIQRSAVSSGFRSLFRRGQGGERPNLDSIRKRIEEAREKMDKKVYGVLTISQRAKFEKMKGKPIDRKQIRGGAGSKRKSRPDV